VKIYSGKTRKSWFYITFIAVSTGLLVLTLYCFNAFDYVEWMLLDRAFKLRPARQSTLPIVIVEIDKKSLFGLGQWPWSRDIHARLTTDLSTFGAKCIAFDIFFALESDSTSALEDFFFAQALMLSGNAYLPINFDIVPYPPPETAYPLDRFACNLPELPSWLTLFKGIELPIVPSLYESTKGVGHISVIEDKDGKIRRVPLWLERNGNYFPQMGLKVFLEEFNINSIEFPKRGFMHLIDNDGKVYRVPIDSNAQFSINWLGTFEKSLPSCSYIDVLTAFEAYSQNQTPEITIYTPEGTQLRNALEVFKDSFCIVGFTTAGLLDQKPVPVDNRYPLLGIHANVLDNIANGSHFINLRAWHEILLIFFIAGIATLLFMMITPVQAVGMGLTLCVLVTICVSWIFMRYSVWIQTTYLYAVTIFSFIATALYHMRDEKKKKKEVESIFKRYVTSDVVEAILKNPDAMRLGGTRKEVTVLFCDIRGFTELAEQLPPEEVINLLNLYFSRFIKIIFKHHGTIDKFIGDCIMAFWGDPAPEPNHAYEAVLTAIEIQQDIHIFNEQRLLDSQIKLEVGIGINTGDVVVGNVGLLEKSFQRTEYTVIGDTVNIAARLVDLAPKNTIFMGETTFSEMQGRIHADPHPPVKVRGRLRPLPIYKIEISHDSANLA
jgi:adenylate cyclase